MKKIFIHIGFHKTGTTFLQQKIFPFLEDVNYISNGRLLGLAGPYQKTVISNEALSGIPYHPNEKSYYDQFCFNISQLKAVFEDFNVIIGFREPSSMVNSLYKQYLHEGGTVAFDEFFGDQPHSIVKENDLYFSKFYAYLLGNFSAEKLFCFDQGQLVNEPGRVIRKLLQFLDQEDKLRNDLLENTKLNVSVPDNLENLLLYLNRLDIRLRSKYGVTLNNKYFKRHKITPRTLTQYILPKILGRKKQRNLEVIKAKYAMDWDTLATKIRIQ